ncbi:MAG TPA: hypothetical protein VFG73_11555 [Rhodanobacteraceae bacterium]|nr:hypothetical protein [Rhodanobacteraceae bacterium]
MPTCHLRGPAAHARRLFAAALLGLAAIASAPLALAQLAPQLAPAPTAPATQDEPQFAPFALAVPQAAQADAQAVSVDIDPFDRNAVALAYQEIYLPQGQVPSGWNGNVGSCNPGSVSLAYRQATIARVNFYRALAGLPGNITLMGGTAATDTQAAALMFSANRALSHSPPSDWLCYTSAGYNGAHNSNIAAGYGNNAAAGPGAIDLYMVDSDPNNSFVGHRRWVLYPARIGMDTGSVPYGSNGWASNALWVFGPTGPRPPTPFGVAWPPQGYVPWQLLPAKSNRWSFSWPGADFSNATVSMSRDGVPLDPPGYEPLANGYGENTLVWLPPAGDAGDEVSYARPGHDTDYHVVITGIRGGGAPATIDYDVVVIDPWVIQDVIFTSSFE